MQYLYMLICTIATIAVGASVIAVPAILAMPIALVSGAILFVASGKLVEWEKENG